MGNHGVYLLASRGFSVVVVLIVVSRLVSRFVLLRLVVQRRTVASFSAVSLSFHDHDASVFSLYSDGLDLLDYFWDCECNIRADNSASLYAVWIGSWTRMPGPLLPLHGHHLRETR